MTPPESFRDTLEKQFNFIQELLQREPYRYLLDSGDVEVVFDQRRFEVHRRITGPNNSPIYQIVYDAIDHLEDLHSKSSIEVPVVRRGHLTASVTKAHNDPLRLYVRSLKRQGISGTKTIAQAIHNERNDSFVRHNYLLKLAEEFEIEKPTWKKVASHRIGERRLASYFCRIK